MITGRVTETRAPGAPISSASVKAFDGVSFSYLGDVNTDASGYYTISTNAPYNQIKLYFDASGYSPEWFDNQQSFGMADSIATTGTLITGKNAQLDRANAALVGTVIFTPSGQLVEGARVEILRATDARYVKDTTTSSNGAFTITGLISNVYKVQVIGPPVATEWYQDHPATNDPYADLAAATPVRLAAETTRTLTLEVAPTAVITGRLTDAGTGQPISNTSSGAVRLYHSSGTLIDPIAKAGTDASGTYTLTGIAGGQYKVWFGPSGYAPELYDDLPADDAMPPVRNFNAATVVTVAAGQTLSGIDAALSTETDSAAITGTVTSYSGTAMAGVIVELWALDPETGEFVNSIYTQTNASGVYAFTDLPDNVYRVRVGAVEHFTISIYPLEIIQYTETDPAIAPHAVEWFNDAYFLDAATNITLTGGTSQTGKDIQLSLGGCIAGKILDGKGTAMSEEPFQVYQVANNNRAIPVWTLYGMGWSYGELIPPFTDIEGYGEFRACGLPDGSYVVSCDHVNTALSGMIPPWIGNREGERITTTVKAGQVIDIGVCTVNPNKVYLPLVLK